MPCSGIGAGAVKSGSSGSLEAGRILVTALRVAEQILLNFFHVGCLISTLPGLCGGHVSGALHHSERIDDSAAGATRGLRRDLRLKQKLPRLDSNQEPSD